MRYTKEAIKGAQDELREWLKPGDTVYCILRHVSKSGMLRAISPVTARDNSVQDISWLVARAIGRTLHNGRQGGVKMGGCGMDMGFALVYELSKVLYPDGFECIGEGCPSCDHSNGDRDYTPHHHTNGGYALQRRWL